MRAFQPIARRMEAERNRNLWGPPPALRRTAWCILLCSLAYMIAAGGRLAFYLFAVERSPNYAMTHTLRASPFLIIAALVVMLLSMPFVIPRASRGKKRHVPDPALSIRPR
jgi:hypothetical protein